MRFASTIVAILLLAACQSGAPPAPTPVPPTATPAPTAVPAPTARPAAEARPVPGGPLLLRAGIALRRVAGVEQGAIKLALSPADNMLYLLHPASGLQRVDLQAGTLAPVTPVAEMVGDATPAGMAFGPDGTLFVVANRKVGATQTQALVRRGAPTGSGFSWQTLAKTRAYPLSNTPFDHLWNGIAAAPDGKFVFVNSGSRTDHGEVEDNGRAYPDLREVPITSAIFRLPADATDLELPNDEAALKPYLFADGVRNAFDPEFAPSGELFAGDNGPDADFPDELNLLAEGRHYGFPWRFGVQENPQQFPDYDSAADQRLSQDFTAVKTGTYRNDPGFLKAPEGGFADPIANLGPAAAQYRGDDGQPRDAAAEGRPLHSFTPHRSPLGLVFVRGEAMPADFRAQGDGLSAFLLSWGAAGGTLSDRGQDLLHLALKRSGESYAASAQQIAREFKFPIDAVLIGQRLYVLEWGQDGAIWELTFEG